MPRFRCETPLEFGSRLKHLFPVLRKEVESIIDLYNQEVCGGIAAGSRELTNGMRAWRQLRSPVHWVNRFKVWFFNPTFPLR